MRLRPIALVVPTVVAAIVLVIALASAKSSPATSPAAAQSSAVVHSGTMHVKVYMFAFEPAKFTVKVGTKITFHNMDATAHTATALNYKFNTGTINPGQSKTIVVKKAGVYPYHCLFHAFMTGTLTVVN